MSTTDSLSFTRGKMSFIRKVMSYPSTRILIMIFFFLFIYKIIYAIGVFFAINTMVLSMWLCWLAMFVAFVSFLPVRNGLFYVKHSSVVQATTALAVTQAVPGALASSQAAAGATSTAE